MKVRCLLIGVVVLFVAGVLTASSYAKIDPKTVAGIWLFDESSGKTAKDSSENGNDGTLMNGPKWVDGKFSKALEFNGVDNYVSLTPGSSLNITDFTLSSWIKGNTWTGNSPIVEKRTGEDGNYGMWVLGTGNLYGEFHGTAWRTLQTPDTLSFSKWYHISFTYDRNQMKLYIDGVLKASGDQTETPNTTANVLRIGTWVSQTVFFDGIIDEVAIFNVALTEDEIKRIIEGGLKATVTAVESSGKISTVWGGIKARY
jgi:hypothetical protein